MSETSLVPDHLLLAIDHVGIAVPDLDDALEFYASTFGLRSIHEEVNEEQGVREAMLAVGDSGSCIQLRCQARSYCSIRLSANGSSAYIAVSVGPYGRSIRSPMS